MKGFHRDNQLFSLCGLNCGLCPMHLNKYCPGCGGGEGNQSCKIAKCSLEHDGVEYCFRCREYPCEKCEHIDDGAQWGLRSDYGVNSFIINCFEDIV